jgi:transcriptional regulator with GAF, ATPase, and Fis domain
VEPIPETARAIADFGPFIIENEDLLRELLAKAHRVRALVPQCLGISVASTVDQVTFTLVATAKEVALLDAVQYISGGPCVDAVEAERVLAYEQSELFDEEEWQLVAHATAAASVASTLTLPILVSGQVGGSVNLYATTPDAFDGHMKPSPASSTPGRPAPSPTLTCPSALDRSPSVPPDFCARTSTSRSPAA